MDNPVFRGVFEIAMAALGISILTLLIKNSSGTVAVTGAASSGFVNILNTLTGQGMGGSYGLR